MMTADPKQMSAPRTWHDREIAGVFDDLATRRDGLTRAEAEERLRTHGPNRLPEPPRRGPIMRFLSQFHNVLIYVLLAAAAVTGILEHWVDTGVILLVVVANAIVGFLQEGKAENALEAIRDMLAPRATVLRGGQRESLPGEAIVPGDIVILEAGDRVPADLRLIEVRGLKTQEAMLTGESVAVEKAVDPVAATAPLAERLSMAFSGTMVAAGQGRGIVAATGARTEIGRISGLIADVHTLDTPLIVQMGAFARLLTGFILIVSALIMIYGLNVTGYGFKELFMAVVGLAVAAIPEGLPAILTVTLAIGVQAMAQRHAIVRKLPAIEALGSVSVICSDKTGTLTRNEMTVASIATSDHAYAVSGTGYAPHGGFSADGQEISLDRHPEIVSLARAALMCSDADLVAEGPNDWKVVGDPMEGALVALAAKAGLDAHHERQALPQTDAIPFDSDHRFMATLHHDHTGAAAIYVKGAPERLFEMATSERRASGDMVPIDVDGWRHRVDELAAEGQRVLAIAIKRTTSEHADLRFEDVEGGLTLLGLVGLIDPPREEAIAAVAECLAAGIRVKMITGDHAGTAAAIARQLGLANPSDVLQGADIDTLDAEALKSRAMEVDVFARTTPEHKLRLVEAMQDAGAVVAMTGDGVNDAPALKRAHIGIAMGQKGTEAAKEAAEIVLADDNFATIAAAVKAGRTVYDNLTKAIVFLLPVNGGESISLVAALLMGLTLPITPLQILWVNMVSSVLLAMTLAFEKSEPGVMRRPPRPPGQPILSGFVVWRVVFVSALFSAGIFGKFALAEMQGADVAVARTIAVNTLVAMEVFYLFSVRYLNGTSLTATGFSGTRPVIYAITAVTLLQLGFTYIPAMEDFFDTRPLTMLQGLQVISIGVAVLLVLELEKRIRWAIVGRPGAPGDPPGGRRSAEVIS